MLVANTVLVTGQIVNSFANLQTLNITTNDTVIAENFVDLTPGYDRNRSIALQELNAISSHQENNRTILNHSTLPSFAKKTVIYNGVLTEARSLGAMISMVVEAFKEVTDLITSLFAADVQHESQIADQETRIQQLQSELCRTDPSYAWCSP